jgi:phospholipase D1/2
MQSEAVESPRKRWLVLLPPGLAAAALLSVWFGFDLSSFRSLEQVQASLAPAREDPWALLYVGGAFAVLSPLFVPITGLVVATVLTFGSVQGCVYALLGIYGAACTTYWSGRMIGSRALFELSGPTLKRATLALQGHAFWASLLSRVAPVGNFTVMNMLAGGMRIPFLPFLLGSALGVIPGTVLIALFAEKARGWLQGSENASGPWLSVGLVAVALLTWGLVKVLRKRSKSS